METTKSVEPMMELSDHDPVFADMALSNEAYREIFKIFCVETFKEQKTEADEDGLSYMVFKDWKVWWSMLTQVGFWEIQDKQVVFPITTARLKFELSKSLFEAEGEEGSRLYRLNVKGIRTLPKGIHRLDGLGCLSLEGKEMTSLPLQELNSLPKLKRLELHGASKLLSDSLCALSEMEKLTRVTKLSLSGVHSLQLLRVCPAVDDLELEFSNPGDMNAILDLLGSIELEKLQCMRFKGSKMNGEQLANFVLKIAPRFPNLEALYFGDCCAITDFRDLSKRLRNGESRALSKSLKRLQMKLLESTNPVSKENMLTLLKFFTTIEHIDFGYGSIGEDLRTDPDVRYALVKNLVGRQILRGGGSRLPLSAWPIVLHRAQNIDRSMFGEWNFPDVRLHGRFGHSPGESPEELRSSLVATGIYYLLREGSALIGRRDLVVDGGGAKAASKSRKRERKNYSTLVPAMKKRKINDEQIFGAFVKSRAVQQILKNRALVSASSSKKKRALPKGSDRN